MKIDTIIPTPTSAVKTAATAAIDTPKSMVAEQLRQQWGGNWKIKGIDRAQELATIFEKQGITDLRGLKVNTQVKETPYEAFAGDEWVGGGESGGNQWVSRPAGVRKETIGTLSVGGKTIGSLPGIGSKGNYEGNGKAPKAALDQSRLMEDPNAFEIGRSFAGEGGVFYNLIKNPKTGRPVIVPIWSSSSDKDKALKAMSVMAMVFSGGLANPLGAAMGLTGTAATAAGSAAINTGLAALNGAKGGDLLRGAAAGAIGGGIGSVPGVSSLPQVAQSALGGVLSSGIRSKGDTNSMLMGGITGATGGAFDPNTAKLLNFLLQGYNQSQKTRKP